MLEKGLYTNKIEGWLSTGEINLLTFAGPQHGQGNVSKFIESVVEIKEILSLHFLLGLWQIQVYFWLFSSIYNSKSESSYKRPYLWIKKS